MKLRRRDCLISGSSQIYRQFPRTNKLLEDQTIDLHIIHQKHPRSREYPVWLHITYRIDRLLQKCIPVNIGRWKHYRRCLLLLKSKHDPGSNTFLAACMYMPMHQIHHLLYQGKSQSAAFKSSIIRVGDILSEDVFQLLGIHSHTGIFHASVYLYDRTVLLFVTADGTHNGSTVGKLRCIGQQILEDLPHARLIADHHLRKLTLHPYHKINRLLVQIHQADMCLFLEQIIEIVFFLMQSQLSCFQLGIHQNGINLLKQRVACIVNISKHRPALRRKFLTS